MAPEDVLSTAIVSVQDATRHLAARLQAAGVDTPARDARLLVAAAAGLSQADLIRDPSRALDADTIDRLQHLTARRAAREPVSRILGAREFYGREFLLSPATLDPRPDSETLIGAVLEVVAAENLGDRPLRLIDIGTGTGCLLLTLLAELPHATGIGTDISGAALEVAQANAQRLGLAERSVFRLQRSLEGCCDRFDILVSNPPYIPSGEIAGLAPEVRAHDPRLALDGGEDGLAFYREIAATLDRVAIEIAAFFEIGAGQEVAVQALFHSARGAAGARLEAWRDLDGRVRCVAVRPRR